MLVSTKQLYLTYEKLLCAEYKVMNMEYTLSGNDRRLVGGGGEEAVSITHTHLKLKYLSPAMFSPSLS